MLGLVMVALFATQDTTKQDTAKVVRVRAPSWAACQTCWSHGVGCTIDRKSNAWKCVVDHP